jgi:hypothetical protein
VIPAGAEVSGVVVNLASVAKMQRATAILGGDFTPLHRANIRFTEVTLPSGVHMPLSTVANFGLASIYDPPRPKKAKSTNKPKKDNPNAHPADGTNTGGVLHTGKVAITDQINAQLNGRTRGIVDIVRAPNKKEKIEDYLWSRLPYHPQWVKRGTRFDSDLDSSLAFGSAIPDSAKLGLLGTQPPPDSIVHARLIQALDSGTASVGDPVEAVVSAPLFAGDGKLILPTGTHLVGKVTTAASARWFHRGGQLRFNFETIEIPAELRAFVPRAPQIDTPAPFKTVATIDGAENSGKTAVKVDGEGTVKATEPKTRFIAPALALLVASRAMDNDSGHAHASGSAGDSNTGGRTLGGISGFGVFGGLAAHISPSVSSALGLYGLGWSVYATVISRGGEVEFQRNAALDIRFGGRRSPGGP